MKLVKRVLKLLQVGIAAAVPLLVTGCFESDSPAAAAAVGNVVPGATSTLTVPASSPIAVLST